MVGVEMAEEDIIDEWGRHLQGDGVADTAITQIEEESARLWFTIPKLDQNARAFLQPCWRPRRASQKRYPHFVLGQDFRARELHVAVFDCGPWSVIIREADASTRPGTIWVTSHRLSPLIYVGPLSGITKYFGAKQRMRLQARLGVMFMVRAL